MLLRIKVFAVKEGRYQYGMWESMEGPFGFALELENVLRALCTEKAQLTYIPTVMRMATGQVLILHSEEPGVLEEMSVSRFGKQNAG